MKKYLAMLLALAMMLSLAACGGSEVEADTPVPSESVEAEEPVAEEMPAEEAAEEEAPAEEVIEEEPAAPDFTESNAAMDFSAYRANLKNLTATLPITEEDVTVSFFLACETNSLNYIPGNAMENHQIYKWLDENTGVHFDMTIISKSNETDHFNLMVASGDYLDLMPAGDYTTGVEAAYEDEVFQDLTDLIPEYMPNYWTIINSDKNLLNDVTDGGKLLQVCAIKDQVINPNSVGPFVRMDWLEELNMEVPQTYDELTEVLRAFKSEKGAVEPLAMFNTINLQNGVLIGGFGVNAELSTNGMGTDVSAAFYQEDGKVIYGATQEGTRKFLTWLHELYEEDLIHFENMINRSQNPFGKYNATMAADGTNGYIFSNQPFGGNYSIMAAEYPGQENCNWWPVQDVAETAGQTIPFYENVTLVDSTKLAISTQCEHTEELLAFLDFGYSYEGAVLYNYGFEIGSGEGTWETFYYDENGDPQIAPETLDQIAPSTNLASSAFSTRDLAGICMEDKLSFEFGERELSCFSVWSTNKTTQNNLGADVSLTSEEMNEYAFIYGDIITYVATCVLQFINGDLDISGEDWEVYVQTIEDMNLAELTEIVQIAYDRAYA